MNPTMIAAAVVDEVVKEQQVGKIYKFMTIGLFIVCVVLIGALTGITWAIVNLSKEVKAANSNANNGNYQFLVTKDDKATVTGGAVLGLSSSLQKVTNGTVGNLTASVNAASSRRRALVSMDDFNATKIVLYGTLDFPTVQEGCEILYNGLTSFLIRTNSSLVGEGSLYTTATIVEETGCDNVGSREVTAYVNADGNYYILLCHPGLVRDDAAKTGYCEVCVLVDGRAVAVRMDELKYGDLVRSYDRITGAVSYKPVYLFGHRQAGGAAMPYLHITAAGRTLVATGGHFLPVCAASCTAQDLAAGSAVLENRRAADVAVGDVVLLVGGTDGQGDGDGAAASPALATVSHVDTLLARGAFNPYVRGADLIVDGVVASPHSDWILDAVAPAWMVPYLPYIYEVLLAPVYGLYCMVGPATAEWLAHGLGLADVGSASHYGIGYVVVLASFGAPLLVSAAALLGGSKAKRPLRMMKH
ncbi:hypothetical protein GPECTOR_533g535 [Gonium pectorale]|uniref:Hedgehog protein Hint domain-containing protein n=1 Tax=Gonium pectorale TaxID=33097 RepID=A0A150FUN1_GONPE|nr:hypothetical protein GPECTOR_533g535 [Gonium pectorale]|eukprot:KXZ41341.1 hypothetical protein GPECTOR_533g535 [Gonium pectorale]